VFVHHAQKVSHMHMIKADPGDAKGHVNGSL
jgi:hypothetical protein